MRYSIVTMALCVSLAMAAAPAHAQQVYPAGYYGQAQGWRGVLSPQDQQQYDDAYAKWVSAVRRQDRDDIAVNAAKMQSIMARYGIPSNTGFEQVATTPVPPYPGTVYANQNGYATGPVGQMSADDQRKFDKEYAKWVDAQRKNDSDDVAEHAANMQKIMARYNIPATVPFQTIATGTYPQAVPAVPVAPPAVATYPYGYAQAPRLSADDQKAFDKDYRNWVKAQRKRDVDDINGNARKMQDIMARYNIPANVAFSQIASPDALSH